MLGSVGFWEILIIFVIIAILFGGRKLPELGKGIGEGIKNFKNALKKEKNENNGQDEKDH